MSSRCFSIVKTSIGSAKWFFLLASVSERLSCFCRHFAPSIPKRTPSEANDLVASMIASPKRTFLCITFSMTSLPYLEGPFMSPLVLTTFKYRVGSAPTCFLAVTATSDCFTCSKTSGLLLVLHSVEMLIDQMLFIAFGQRNACVARRMSCFAGVMYRKVQKCLAIACRGRTYFGD